MTCNGYTAAYDVAGNMTCRAPTTSQTCSGSTPTGQTLGYDALRRLLSWQNAATNPTQTASYAYDGGGERVWQQVTNSGTTTTTTTYVGPFEELRTSGSTTTTLKYYAAGVATAVSVNGTLSYLASDGLGSTTVALSATGTVSATQLYTPYGSTRYSSGSMPTALGFTGQYLDGSGLNYYHARYSRRTTPSRQA